MPSPPLRDVRRLSAVARACATLAQEVTSACREGMIPIAIGGDHSMSIGSVAGFADAHAAHGRMGLLWVDAHLDSNTPSTSPSQAIHGMPLATLLGFGHAELLAIGEKPVTLDPRHVCVVGSRSMGEKEAALLSSLGVRVIAMEEVRRIGLKAAFDQAMDIVGACALRYLSLDLDSIDPADAPGVGIAEPHGIAAGELLQCLGPLVAKARFMGFDIAEYHPLHDEEGKTALLVRNVINTIRSSLSS